MAWTHDDLVEVGALDYVTFDDSVYQERIFVDVDSEARTDRVWYVESLSLQDPAASG